METTNTVKKVNTNDLELKVKKMYRNVALHPEGDYHFEMGRELAEKLGYQTSDLDGIPSAAIESFAGVGYFHDLANLKKARMCLTSAADREWIHSLPHGRLASPDR
jgi:arsenite methyltransferase